ncbi:titin isoform X2 [Coccinella septempunctata]|uniref:titin isoform X2 n=1 Tax=Coccinella septempunctata TaxID=41139 RepID=UPI001D07BD4F|nr:titin isoform X2 [Coccinella septempunctata]
MPIGGTKDGREVPILTPKVEETAQEEITPTNSEDKLTEGGPSIRVSEVTVSDAESKQFRVEDLKSDDEFHTASECTLRHSRSSTYDSASECEARYSPWWEYDRNMNKDISKEKMVLAVGCPQLPPPAEVLKPSPVVPPGKIVHEVIETTHIRVEHSHTLGVKSFVLSSETVRDKNTQGFDTSESTISVANNIDVKREDEEADDGGLLKKLEECGNWLQLKILEITPELTKLGATLGEALELQKAHDEVLRQLQNKQSPVEELLRQADQLIATQKPRAEVYAAMAETLGRAWRDINYNLELRKHILDLNVQYHLKAEEFFDKIRSLENSCTDTVVPIEIDAVKQFLTTIHELRRTLLESLMAALQAGNSLLGKLKALGAEGTLDSRPDHIRQSINKALSQVQSWLDELHVKRQDVEAIFNKRKLQLEQCLALAILATDLRELEDCVNNCRNRLANADQLGDSLASTELLLHENKKLLPEAQILQERALKITKATEQLLASGCFAGEEATKQSYAILSMTSDYMTELQNRNSLLERVMAFFKSTQSAFGNLGQLEIQLTSSDLKPTSPQLTQLHAQCSKAIEEITAGPIAEGHSILQSVGRGSTGIEGVKRTVEDLENIKIRLDALCVAHREENLRINRALDNFFDTYSSIQLWLSSIAEAFLKSHRNMGSELSEANEFMDLHRKLLTDLQDKGNEINSLLLTLPPIVQYLDDERRKDVDGKVEELHERWTDLKNILKNRLDLGKIYVKFHSEADIVNAEIDKLELEFLSHGTDIDDDTFKRMEIKWESLEPLYQSAKNTGLTFINDARKVSEPHLDTNRACACVEAVLERLSGRQLQVTRTWQTIQADVIEKRELLIKLEETVMESTKTINWVTKLEAQLYPVVTSSSEIPNEIAASLRTKLETILPDIRRAQNEVEQKIRTADALIAKTKISDEKVFTVKRRLDELNQKLIDISAEYQKLVQDLIDYFGNLQDLKNYVRKIDEQMGNVMDITDINKIRAFISEYETSVQIMNTKMNRLLDECDALTRKILKQEPQIAASHDVQKLRHTLEVNRVAWETQNQRIRELLDKQYKFCQFDQDLNNINRSISNLEQQNQELKNKHGKSLDEARSSSFAYGNFEKTIQDLDRKIGDFIVYGERLMTENYSHSPTIQKHITELQDRWSNFKVQIQQTRHLIDLSIQYFQLIQEADQWFKEGNTLLVSIARRSTLVKRPEEAEELLREISTFLRPGEEKQNERIRRITELAEEIYGRELPTQLNHVLDESREMIKSFSIIQEELDTLSRNLIRAEQEKIRLQKEREEEAAKLAAAREALALEEARAAAERERIALETAKRIELENLERERQAALQEARAAAEKERIALEEARRVELENLERQRQASLQEARAAAEKERIALEEAKRIELENLERQRQTAIQKAKAERERLALEEAKKIELENLEKLRQSALEAEKEKRSLEESINRLKEEESLHRREIEYRTQIIQEVQSVQRTSSAEQMKEIMEVPKFVTPLADAVIQEGSKFSFICQVTGHPAPTIIWYKAGVPIQNNPDYQTSNVQGMCTLTIEETFSDDSARYTCKATNSAGIAETSAFLSVKETEPQEQLLPPSFTKLLEPACVREGSSFEFHCKVEGNPLPNVQWHKNQECIDYAPGYNITYNNGDAVLKIENVELKDKAEYTCKASNQLGSAQSTANLIVTPMIPTRPPVMILPLSNVMARAGQKIKLECEVTGLPAPEIVWFQNDLPLKETRELKLQREGDRATLVIYEAFPKDAGNYKVTATNIAGEASSVCSVSVKGRLPNETSDSEIASDMEPVKPSIQLPLTDVTVNEGSRVRLDCVIVGQPEPEVIWYHDNRPVKESSDFQLLFQGDRCSLVIQEAFSEDAGEYKVVALNSAGEASSKCSLFIKPTTTPSSTDSGMEKNIPVGFPPKFNSLLTDILVSEGEQVKFEGNVSGQPRPDIKWLLNNLPITLNDNVKVSHDEDGNIKLEIKEVQPQDKGVYTVKAINEHGEAKCFAQLIVKSSRVPDTVTYEEVKTAPVFTELFNDKTAFENTSTKFECIVTGKPKPRVKWLFCGEPLNGNNFLVSTSGDRQVLSIPNITKDTEGTITCIAENEVGTASCAAKLTVHQLSTISLPDQANLERFMDSSFSIKREVHTESSTKMSSSVVSSGVDIPEPQTKIHSFSSHSEKTFRQVNQETPEISESHNVEEYLQLDNKQPIIHEKSSSTFSNVKSQSDVKSIQPTLFKPVGKSRAPKFTTPVIGKIVDQNTTVILEGIVDGLPTPSIVWTKNGKDIIFSDKISAKWEFNKASLEIKDTNSNDAGRYTCTAMNEAGTAISTADLVVRKTIFPPVFGRRLQAQVIKKGDRIVMEVEVTGTPEPTITWFKDSVPVEQALTENYKIKSFGNSHTLVIEKADLKHSGRFMVRALNSGGEAQSIADIAVFEPTPDTMVEVVKTVVFEDVRKHETLTSAADRISSPATTKTVEKTSLPPPTLIPESKLSTFESSLSTTSKSEFSSFTEQQVSQQISKARLEYTAPEIPHPKPLSSEFLEKKMDFEVVGAPPAPDLSSQSQEETEEGIQTSSISKESSLQYFVKKIEESKDIKEVPLENYKKFEHIDKKEKKEFPVKVVQEPLEAGLTKEKVEIEHTIEDFDLKPEPPATICFSEPVTKEEQVPIFKDIVEDRVHTLKIEKERETSSYTAPLTFETFTKKIVDKEVPISDSQYYEEKVNITHETTDNSSMSMHYEKFTRGMSPRPEALEMEKLWLPKREIERPLSVTETFVSDKPSHVRSYSYSERDYSTEAPRIHYVANVSHCIEPCEKKIENLFTKSEKYEKFERTETKSADVIEERNVKPSQVAKEWAPMKSQPSFKSYPTMGNLTIRPPSAQDIPIEVYLEPGPPPIMDYAEPPKARRQSYVETVEQELETKLETVPAKVPPGAVRTIPPPPPPKVAPPPLPPKNEQPIAPPIPAKPIKSEFKKKIIEIEKKEEKLDLEPFPFKPDPVKPKPSKIGPPPTPSKFIKGRFTDSDYESDFESIRIPPKWKPCASDNEEPSYRKVRPPKLKESKRSKSTEPEPLPPSKFDHPPQFQGPPRPEVSLEHHKRTTQTIRKETTKQSVKPQEITIASPPIKPGTPPLYIEAPAKKIDSPKTKRRTVIDGYMADTDEPFFQQKSSKSETHEVGSNFSRYEYKSENVVQSSQTSVSSTPFIQKISHPKKLLPHAPAAKKELTATPIITNLSTEKRDESYEIHKKMEHHSRVQQQRSKTLKCPPPPSPTKFVKGEFRESDYESDYDKPIPKIWKPNGPEESPNFRPVRPVLTPTGRQSRVGKTPTPPTEFEEPLKTAGPPRPKFEPIEKPLVSSVPVEISKPEAKSAIFKPKPLTANQTTDITRYIPLRPGTPPEIAYASSPQTVQYYRSTTSMPFHNAIQTETSNKVHFKESSEKCHRTVSVEQSTKVIKFGEKQTGVKIEPYSEIKRSTIRGPPPTTPKKFIPGEFRESDYESDVENVRIKPKWAPSGSDTDDLHYRPVRPPSSASRSSSVPPSKERVVTPMEYDKYPYKSTDTTDSEVRKMESSSYNKYSSSNSNLLATRSRSYEPPVKRIEIQPGSPPEYGFISDPKFKSKATSIASHHMDNMTQQFKSKTQKFVRDIMNDVGQQTTPKKSILKNGEDRDAQVYREETRAAQYGTKHVDPDTGLIYFKYDFGYEFGIVLPGESKNGGIPERPKTIIEPPKRTRDIEMPVFHETTQKTKSNQHAQPKTQKTNRNIKWEPTSESELSEYEGNAQRSQGSDKHRMTETPPSCPETPVNASRGTPGPVRAPMFITPLRNIAVVSGQNAKFECIVQSEPPPSVLWSKNGRIIEDSNDYQLHYRNGVCRLTISRTYPEDAGTYTCTATNVAGTASTTAILDVPGVPSHMYGTYRYKSTTRSLSPEIEFYRRPEPPELSDSVGKSTGLPCPLDNYH